MKLQSFRIAFCLLAAAAISYGASPTLGLKAGTAKLASAGPLAFGPEGVLLVGDSKGAVIWAIDTGDTNAASAKPVEVSGLNEKAAAMVGATPDRILIHDMVVNPISKNVYISLSLGRGPDAQPVLLRASLDGKLTALDLDDVAHSSVRLPNPVATDAKDRRGRSRRAEAITDLHYVDGKVFIAGLSNEEFASTLRSVTFPFDSADAGTSVEIFHGAHGRWETNSPVRTFVPYEIKAEPHLLAAYTCTPLVKFPIADLKPGTKVVGTTIAELGNRNRPLDMIVYERGGTDYILMNNSSRGVMKMSTDKIETFNPIKERTDITGLPYETIEELKGVEQLDKFGDKHAVILARAEGGQLNLKTIDLP